MRRLKTGGRDNRRKALFGEAAAILTAAGINAASTAASAAVQAAAAKSAANTQAASIKASAQTNAQALKQQNDNAKQLQTQSMEFTKDQYRENRNLQKDIQLSLQMLTGAESMTDRKQTSKIQVKNGGLGTTRQSLLRGNNMPFHITDGGGAMPIGSTPEGFNLYELYGNDHEHYHKTKNGKAKTGVGIKFGNGDEIEGEGNQGTSNGELLLTTPQGGYFISKHNIAGFNPAKAVKQGMHPITAFNTQEVIKDMNGISDDGKHNSSPLKKRRRLRLAGGDVAALMSQNYPQIPDFSTDITAPAATGVVYALQQNEDDNKAKFGRRVLRGGGRHKALTGANAQWMGAGINAVGNLGAALINSWGNNTASNVLSGAYREAGDIVADAYRNMTGIDMNSIRKEDYAAAHYLPAIRSAYYDINPQLSLLDRSASRRRSAVERNSLSSAAMLSRLGKIDSDTTDEKMKLYGEKGNREDVMNRSNLDAINQAAAKNAELDTQANQQYNQAYLNLLQYNNDINNQKLAGVAEALSGSTINSAAVKASSRQANANAWGSAISQSALGFGNTLSAMAKYKQDRENVLLGSNNDAYYRNLMMNGSKAEKAAAIKQLDALIEKSTGKTKEQYQIWKDMITL